ncbi:MAG: DUF3810 family protein [Trueperaceae bacterium]|nr:DUF3810 family protein [Trueperaceae bacterium]
MPLTNGLPFSLAGILLLVLPLLWLLMVTLSFKKRHAWHSVALIIWRTVLGLLLITLLFVINWGANYGRESIETQFGLQTPQVSEADLERLLSTLTVTILETSSAERDEAKAMASLVSSLKTTVVTVTGKVPNLPQKVKRLPDGSLILLGRASGVMSPWTLEPHIDGALPEISYLAIGAHELAHVAGYAGEADADFISALAGLKASDPFARYAVALRFWQQAYWQLPQEKQAAFLARLPDSSRQDLNAMVAPFQKYQMPQFIQNLQQRSYNSYLKSQGVTEGIKDYSRTIDLLIQAQKQGLI